MKKHLIALLAVLSLGQMSFIEPVLAQNPRVTIPDFADLVERASPAVVNIRTTEKVMVQQQGAIPGMPEDQAEFFRRFFGVPIPPKKRRKNSAWSSGIPGIAPCC